MDKLLLLFLSFFAGGVVWTIAEYILHRGWGHRPSKNPFSKEHLAHHADVMYFAPSWMKFAFAVAALALIGGPLLVFVGAPAAAGLAGFLAVYLCYELVHRRLHTHAPKTRYGRWARRHHLYHHFKRPNLNHGVTTPVWDFVFRTLEVPPKIRVPRRQALPWMVDDQGQLLAEFSDDYELVGRPRKSSKPQRASATESASANPVLVG